MNGTLIALAVIAVLCAAVWYVSPLVPDLSGWLFGLVLGLFGGIPAFLAATRMGGK